MRPRCSLVWILAPLALAGLRPWRTPTAAGPGPAPDPFDVSPAVAAIDDALSAIAQAPPYAWRAPATRDALEELAAAARDIAGDAGTLEDAAARREGLGHAAWLLTLALARVDGEAGVSEDAWRDDWTADAATTASLYRLLLGARATVLRVSP